VLNGPHRSRPAHHAEPDRTRSTRGTADWTSSAKDMVTTALGLSRVWVTMGFGILNEVYWPATGQPQVRDLGFIMVGPSGGSRSSASTVMRSLCQSAATT